jgi:hypothetical protein
MIKILMTAFAMISVTTAGGSFVAHHSGASLVRTDTLGGRVALHGAYMPAMTDARALMDERCQGRFDYVEDGDAVEFRCVGPDQAADTELALAADPRH